MGQKCLTVRAKKGTLKSKAWERVRLRCAYFDRKNTRVKRIGVEGFGPSFLFSKIPKALDDLAHGSIPIFISPVPLTFQPYQTSCCSSNIPGCFTSLCLFCSLFLHCLSHLVCWKNSSSSFKTLFCEAFTDVPTPLVDIVNHLFLCMTSVLCNECLTCFCDCLLPCLWFLRD